MNLSRWRYQVSIVVSSIWIWGGSRGRRSRRKNSQPAMPASQPSHALGLDARHPEEVLRVCQVGRKLGKLRVQMGLAGEKRVSTLSVYCFFFSHAGTKHEVRERERRETERLTSCLALTALPDAAMDWRCAPPVFMFTFRVAISGLKFPSGVLISQGMLGRSSRLWSWWCWFFSFFGSDALC